MGLLTDSEQLRLLDELERLKTTTAHKLEVVLKRYGLDKVPAEVVELRKQVDRERNKGRGLWKAIWHGFGIIKSEGDKLYKD